MPSTLPLSLVVPLFDEEGNAEQVATSLLDAFTTAKVPLQLILVDNGSKDGTRAILRRLDREHEQVQIVLLDANEGYGGGILAGMRRASAPLLGYMWGDDQVVALDVLRVYRRLVSEGADLAKIRRVERHDGWRRAAISTVYNTVTLWLFHITSSDANGCPKLFRREAWELLAPKSSDWFLDPEIMIGVAARGLKLAEVDVVFRERSAGRSKVGLATIGEFLVNLGWARLRDHRKWSGDR